MSAAHGMESGAGDAPTRIRWRDAVRRAPKFSLAILLVFVACALLATVLPVADPNAVSLADRLQPPLWSAAGTSAHVLGTDSLGRDVLSRLIHGARISALLGLFVICVAAVIGSTIGLVSGYFGGMTDLVITRLIDASLTIPTIFAVLVLVVILGPGFTSLTLSLVIFLWARFARVVRGEAMRYREKDFVKRAIVVGGSTSRVLLLHVAPNLFDTIIVLATINFGYIIIAEASISFLGLGLPPPTATWGQMVSEGRNYLRDAWWLSMFPGAAIVLVVLALSRIGDWIRTELDPFSERIS